MIVQPNAGHDAAERRQPGAEPRADPARTHPDRDDDGEIGELHQTPLRSLKVGDAAVEIVDDRAIDLEVAINRVLESRCRHHDTHPAVTDQHVDHDHHAEDAFGGAERLLDRYHVRRATDPRPGERPHAHPRVRWEPGSEEQQCQRPAEDHAGGAEEHRADRLGAELRERAHVRRQQQQHEPGWKQQADRLVVEGRRLRQNPERSAEHRHEVHPQDRWGDAKETTQRRLGLEPVDDPDDHRENREQRRPVRDQCRRRFHGAAL